MNQRRLSETVDVGGILVGGKQPVVVQSMTNTDTADVVSTVEQVVLLAEAGSELVRITVNNEAAAAAVPEIAEELESRGCRVPIVGDFHYNGHLLLTRFPECARALAKYRINPGNVGMGRHRDRNFEQMIEVALAHSKPVRIGVNWGSLDQKLLARLMDTNAARPDPKDADEVVSDAIVASAIESAAFAENLGLGTDRIVLSAKVSRLPRLVDIYTRLAGASSHALHLGLTEAGMGLKGIIASSAALAVLLAKGIGDTIRVSLTPGPGGDRAEEVRVARHVLQALGLRHFQPEVTACPGCGRTTSTYFQELAQQIQSFVDERLAGWSRTHPGAEKLQVAVMGCIVNGPGESKHADIGISLPGTGEQPKAPVYIDGRHETTLKGSRVAEEFIEILDRYVEERFGKSTSHPIAG